MNILENDIKTLRPKLQEVLRTLSPTKRKLVVEMLNKKSREKFSRDIIDINTINEDFGNITPNTVGGGSDIIFPQSPTNDNITSLRSDYVFGSGDPSYLELGFVLDVALDCKAMELLPVINMELNNLTYTIVDAVYGGNYGMGDTNIPRFYRLTKGEASSWIGSSSLPYTTLFAKGLDTQFVIVPTTTQSGVTPQDGTSALVKFKKVEDNGDIIIEYLGSYTLTTNTAVKDAIQLSLTTVSQTNTVGGHGQWAMAEYGGSLSTFVGSNIASFNGLFTATYVSASQSHQITASTSNTDGTPMDKKKAQAGIQDVMTLKRWSTNVEAVSYQSMIALTRQDEQDLENMSMERFGKNARRYKKQALTNQTILSINKNAVKSLFRVGVTNAVNAKNIAGIDFNLYISDVGSGDGSMANYTIGEFKDIDGTDRKSVFAAIPNSVTNEDPIDLVNIQQKIVSRIFLVQQFIAHSPMAYKPDFVVTSGHVVAAIKSHIAYKANPERTSNRTLYLDGWLQDIEVWVDPTLDFIDNRVVVGSRGNDKSSGLKFCNYDIANITTAMNEATMSEKMMNDARFALLPAGYSPQSQYFTFAIMCDVNNIKYLA